VHLPRDAVRRPTAHREQATVSISPAVYGQRPSCKRREGRQARRVNPSLDHESFFLPPTELDAADPLALPRARHDAPMQANEPMGHGRINPRLFLSIMLGTACTSSCSSLPHSARSKHWYMDIRPQWLRRCVSKPSHANGTCSAAGSCCLPFLRASSPSAPSFLVYYRSLHLAPFPESRGPRHGLYGARLNRCLPSWSLVSDLILFGASDGLHIRIATCLLSLDKLCSVACSPKACPLSPCHSIRRCCGSKSILT
jgi:hypothetical protein